MRTIETALRELENDAQVVYFRPEAEEIVLPPPPDLSAPDLSAPDPEETNRPAGEKTLR